MRYFTVRLGGGDPDHYLSTQLGRSELRHELHHYALRGSLVIATSLMAAAAAAVAANAIRDGNGFDAPDIVAGVVAGVVWGTIERTIADGSRRISLVLTRVLISVFFAAIVVHLALMQFFWTDVNNVLAERVVQQADAAAAQAEARITTAEQAQHASPDRGRFQKAVDEAQAALSAPSAYSVPNCEQNPYRGCSTEARAARALQEAEQRNRQAALTAAQEALSSWMQANGSDIAVARADAEAARAKSAAVRSEPLAGLEIGLRERLEAVIPALGWTQFLLWSGFLLSIDLSLLLFVTFSPPTTYEVFRRETVRRVADTERNRTEMQLASSAKKSIIMKRSVKRDIELHRLQCERWEGLELAVANKRDDRQAALNAAGETAEKLHELAHRNLRLLEG